ncbi:hypothetical protein HU200_067838 [Digitaria exilis]|uniref:Uncharacterized protein n=1 Tax=Digitaria exilis TaxID=1010633 RepID=A0A835DVY1_9POAL|nr:hypothetical protein HU200_067838 [Digitaria exilis]
MDTAPNALSPDVNSFVPTPPLRAPTSATAYLPPISSRRATPSPLSSPRLTHLTNQSFLASSLLHERPHLLAATASPARGWPGQQGAAVRAAVLRAPRRPRRGLGESFNSSTRPSFDMDPEELFSIGGRRQMTAASTSPAVRRWGVLPLLASAGLVFSDDSLLLPCEEPSGIPDRRVGGVVAGVPHGAEHAGLLLISFSSSQRRPGDAKPPLMATRRLLLRLTCGSWRRWPQGEGAASGAGESVLLGDAVVQVFAGRRSDTGATVSTSSASCASEYWCHGNADTAVRDAILLARNPW